MNKEIENKKELKNNFENIEKLNSELLEKIRLLEIENKNLTNKNKELEKNNDNNSLINNNEKEENTLSKIQLNIEFLNNEIEDKKSQNIMLQDLLRENQEEINSLNKTNTLFAKTIQEKNQEIELLKKELNNL